VQKASLIESEGGEEGGEEGQVQWCELVPLNRGEAVLFLLRLTDVYTEIAPARSLVNGAYCMDSTCIRTA